MTFSIPVAFCENRPLSIMEVYSLQGQRITPDVCKIRCRANSDKRLVHILDCSSGFSYEVQKNIDTFHHLITCSTCRAGVVVGLDQEFPSMYEQNEVRIEITTAEMKDILDKIKGMLEIYRDERKGKGLLGKFVWFMEDCGDKLSGVSGFREGDRESIKGLIKNEFNPVSANISTCEEIVKSRM